MTAETILEHIKEAVRDHNPSLLDKAMQEAKEYGLGVDPVLKAMTFGLDSVRIQIKSHSASVPEFLLALDVFKYGFRKIEALNPKDEALECTERIVIGVVEGDVHDLGKNIVAGVLEACGYQVLDLGRGVHAHLFIEEVKRNSASLLALSCMMSTPLVHMQEVITLSKRDMPDVPILVGGAVLDAQLAAAFGADGYAESAVTAPEEVKRILAGRR